MVRRPNWVRHLMAGSLLAALGGFAMADDARVNGSGKTTQVRRTSVIIGADVRVQDGKSAGKISDIVVNDHGCIEYVVVTHEEKYILVPWGAAEMNYDQRFISLRIGRQQFVEAPSFTGTNWPDLNDTTFTTKIKTVFKVNGTRREGSRDSDDARKPADQESPKDGDANRRQSDSDREGNTDKNPERKSRERTPDEKSPTKPEKKPAPKASDKKDG